MTREGVIRCIGDPEVRFKEDPVRMLRALALAARLDFTIEDAIYDAIGQLRHEIANSSAPRLLEEYYKILRAGSSEKTFQGLSAAGDQDAEQDGEHEGDTRQHGRAPGDAHACGMPGLALAGAAAAGCRPCAVLGRAV